MTTGPLNLAPVDFWNDPARTRDTVIPALLAQGFEGIVLDAPEIVSLAIRDTLPLAGVRVLPLDDDARTDFRRDAMIVVVRVDDNSVHVATAYPWKRPAPKSPPDETALAAKRAQGPRPEGWVASFFLIEARQQLPDLPWQEGTVIATVLLGERTSNRMRCTLSLPPRTTDSAEITQFIVANRSSGYPRPVWPPSIEGVPFPQYRPARPEDPIEASIVLRNVAPVVTLIPQGTWVLRGTFARPVLAREIVRPYDPNELYAGMAGAGWRDPCDADATAVVPITLVMTGSEVVGPYVVHLQVPVYDAITPGQVGALVRGRFAVDLLAVPDLALQPQTYVIYAFTGEVMAGPWTVHLLSPEVLAPP